MVGKVCLVTGANSGIGKETARRLADLGGTVVMVCRNKGKGEKALADIAKTRGGPVELMLADLASFESVRSLAKGFLEKHNSLHVLVNNAGGVILSRSLTVDGIETTFQVDYLSHFLLTNLLLEILKKSAPSRIVNVSSAAHYSGHLDLDDLPMKNGYGTMRAYSRAKLAQVLFTYELARRLQGTGVTANCLHPGVVATNIWKRSMGPLSFVGNVSRLFLISPEEGAETSVYLASSQAVEGVTGKYFDNKQEKESSAESHDQVLAQRLWAESEKLSGLASVRGSS